MHADGLLSQLAGVRAFILYRQEHIYDHKSNVWKLEKIPVDPQTGHDCSPHNPASWMTPEHAQAWAAHYNAQPLPQNCPGYGVGVVISEQIEMPNGLRLFCLDLDKCRDGDRWAPHAAHFISQFPGAAVECSVSGLGLHVYACYRGERPAHSVKNKTYGLELYTRLRFIAVTGIGASGVALIDHTEALHALAAQFFPPKGETEYSDELTDAPVPEWSGPADDDQLIAIGMRIKTARQVFGGKASFSDLFNRNVEVLAKAFPPFKNTPYDESAADLALANSLAWLTGNHGTRIERIMRNSQLFRYKYDRPGYLLNTISMACASQKSWYNDRRGAQLTPPATAAGTVPAQAGVALVTDSAAVAVSLQPYPPNHIGELLVLPQQLYLFAGCIYVEDVYEVMLPDGRMLDSSRFDVNYSGYKFCIDPENKTTKSAWEAFTRSEIYHFPKVRGVFFDPRKAPMAIEQRDGHTYINSWMPIDIPRRKGDPGPFLRHLKKILPDGNDAEILLAYFAAVVQFRGYKFQWWPMIQGVEGNGKTILSKLLQFAVGKYHTHWPKASQLANKFNAAFYGKILICVEDVFSADQAGLWEALKPMITGGDQEVEAKGVDQVTREMCFNGVLNTNHKNGIRKTRNDRRICPFYCRQQHESDLERDGLTPEYFMELRDWIANGGNEIVAEFLHTYPIPDEWNPATQALRAPVTTATQEAIIEGLGYVEQEILEAIQQRQIGFRNGWASSSALDVLLARLGKSSAIPRNKRRDLMETIGYKLHPALPNGRSLVADANGQFPLLYVRKDAQGAQETDPARVMGWFQWSQT